LVEGLGASGQRSGHAPDLPVGLQGEGGVLPVFEQLGQGVLQQRQGPRLILHFGDQLGHQPGLQRHAHPLGRFTDGLLQLRSRQWRQHLGPGPEQLTEARIRKRPVVEVGPQGQHHPDAALGVGGRRVQGCQEPGPPGLVVDQGEQLLELVDHHQQLGVAGGQDPFGRPAQAVLVPLQLSEEAGWGVDRDAQQRRLQLLEGMGARQQLDHEPAGRPGQGATPQGRQQPGPDQRGLSAPGRPHHRQQLRLPAGVGHAGQQLLGRSPAPEEVGGVGLLEGAQPLVGVARLDRLPGSGSGRGGSKHTAERCGQGGRVREPLARFLGGRPTDDLIDPLG
jgi:hypothetical protein